MKIDPNHIPDKYLCEQCEPRFVFVYGKGGTFHWVRFSAFLCRSVDRKRARQIQVKKKESIAGKFR